MNFLEYMFHISPDAGSGDAEFSVITLFSIALVAFCLRWPLWRAISLLKRARTI